VRHPRGRCGFTVSTRSKPPSPTPSGGGSSSMPPRTRCAVSPSATSPSTFPSRPPRRRSSTRWSAATRSTRARFWKPSPCPPSGVRDLGRARLVLALDQITDPHNVGAILRSAVALGADAVVTTERHAPEEGPVLAKSASGALDMIRHVRVKNMARFVTEMRDSGFRTIALDSEGPARLEETPTGDKVLLVLGSEGKGVRQGRSGKLRCARPPRHAGQDRLAECLQCRGAGALHHSRKPGRSGPRAVGSHLAVIARLAFPMPDTRTGDRRKTGCTGENPVLEAPRLAGIAQLVEHLICNQGVAGSNPAAGTTPFLSDLPTSPDARRSRFGA
jgi:tRNA(Leu) C34 or U34 (ribose-2'-O)-methylase TrmL